MDEKITIKKMARFTSVGTMLIFASGMSAVIYCVLDPSMLEYVWPIYLILVLTGIILIIEGFKIQKKSQIPWNKKISDL